MIISYQWLLEYLPQQVSVPELSTILTSIGLEVEAVEAMEKIKGSLEGLIIGEVLTCEKHPNADKLSVTTVNIGSKLPLHIVCGAPNVASGQKIVVAPVGTTVHPIAGEAFLIKKAKIRGADSEGMICAEDEIGLGKSHDGIMVLPADAIVGKSAKEYFNIAETDYAIHVGLTPNRSDAMSHIGVAKDVCAYIAHHQNKQIKPVLPSIELPAKNADYNTDVVVEATDACPRYTGINMTNVIVAPSPEWLQQRLSAIGVRPINNVVDITNFVLHEFGQPLHAFDADKISGKKITVRFLAEGTKFITLDEKERKLRANDLMICDDAGGMCIAGVFGGINSGITNDTKNIFLESAYFSPSFIRNTSLHHELRTDAATHFEKGVDMEMVLPALKRAAALISKITGGIIASEIIDIYEQPLEAKQVSFTYDYINKICGKIFSKQTIQSVLTALNFEIILSDENGMTVKVPFNKTDVAQPADIAEEILRIDGLDNIAIPQRLNISLANTIQSDRKARAYVANQLSVAGFHELITNSITNSKYYSERIDLVKMLNNLSSELDILRPSMLESGLEVIAYNANRKNKDLLLYELGKTYHTATDKFVEKPCLAIWTTGQVRQQQWNSKAENADLFFLKGVVQNLFSASNISNTALSYEGDMILWKWKNQQLCILSSVSNERLHLFDIKQEVFFAEIDWELWKQAASSKNIKYTEVPKFPSVYRDLAIVIDKKISYADVRKTTEQLKLASMQSFNVFDVFESEKLGADKKSYALSYVFQLHDRTLTEPEIEQLMKQLADAYTSKLQAQIRE